MKNVAILGGGNLGHALARGWAGSGLLEPDAIHVTRRHPERLADLAAEGFAVGSDNKSATAQADVVVIAVQPGHLDAVLGDISGALDPDRQCVVSVVTGVSLARLRESVGEEIPLVRAMPNTAVETLDSMTCLSVDRPEGRAQAVGRRLFDGVGRTMIIDEEMMIPATALCACGIAFFLRTIRAAGQGGTEIGFHADDAVILAAQTARGAAELVLRGLTHPEGEIDRVTTPRGCTIAGLNELEHRGFSSAMIRGILTSSRRARELT
ncbi:MAG: pyrroline-5-carboxylate reductase [Acidobacteria bacterium]|nr:pyrroline-5-carboxylate reductase [Acidobacteriota bacterium]NIM60872.1 pyrroline-5-carboxylate reductase [Acidobacteriota bacterium]NIO60406.1 pyrroline-5-carboxylate reductase [Acidobacteriota bacterium]NIQ31501.1 pyrroline-5-carboxylate reductase [Acidobacteriota bacterium]NIQ86737.1 pyrroline-5-carboxylate reductase [Acidobacteriota bacterium]